MQDTTREEIQQALAAYARAFPHRTHMHLTSCQDISNGWEGELFCLRLRYRERDAEQEEEIVLKLYTGESGPRKAQREFHALQWLAEAGYPAPRALFRSLQDAGSARAYVAMERITGETVAPLLDGGSQEQKLALIRRCCRLYVNLHALPPDLSQAPCEGEVIEAWLRQVRTSCQQLPGFFEPVVGWLQEQGEQVTCQRISYLHGDFHVNNLMLQEDGRLVVIDWTGTLLSDYRFDLGWTLLLLRTQGRAELVAPVLEEYERQAGRAVEHLAFFEVSACYRRLFDLVFSARQGAGALGMKPEVADEIRRQRTHVQAVYARLQERTGCVLPQIEAFIAALAPAEDPA
jgi:aminoglycoside phosphotransferase (APT) family kinase protein